MSDTKKLQNLRRVLAVHDHGRISLDDDSIKNRHKAANYWDSAKPTKKEKDWRKERKFRRIAKYNDMKTQVADNYRDFENSRVNTNLAEGQMKYKPRKEW